MNQNIHPLYRILFKTVPYAEHPPGRRGTFTGPGVQFTTGSLNERVLRYLEVHHFGSQTDIAEGIETSIGFVRRALVALQKSGEVQCIQIHGSHPEYRLTKTDTA